MLFACERYTFVLDRWFAMLPVFDQSSLKWPWLRIHQLFRLMPYTSHIFITFVSCSVALRNPQFSSNCAATAISLLTATFQFSMIATALIFGSFCSVILRRAVGHSGPADELFDRYIKMAERSFPSGIDQAAQPLLTDYAPKANSNGDGDELFFDGSAPPPNYSTISGYQNQVPPQASAYENFASYTVMGVQNQQVSNQQSPVCIISLLVYLFLGPGTKFNNVAQISH